MLVIRLDVGFYLSAFIQGGKTVLVKSWICVSSFASSYTLLLLFSFIYLVCACVCVQAHVCVCHSAHVAVRGQLAGVDSLPPPCEPWD